jgi:peptidoglycan/xylan/chitin deacetylase (PgdA/CDA1 family)
VRAGYRFAQIALAFDDGPDQVWTPAVLDALANAGARATFFVITPRAERHPSLLSRMPQAGHTVAFHCEEHAATTALRLFFAILLDALVDLVGEL